VISPYGATLASDFSKSLAGRNIGNEQTSHLGGFFMLSQTVINGRKSQMAALEILRQEITKLDLELLELLAKRRKLSLDVAKSKQEDQRPIRDTAREQELLETLVKQGKPLGLSAQYIQQIYQSSSRIRC